MASGKESHGKAPARTRCTGHRQHELGTEVGEHPGILWGTGNIDPVALAMAAVEVGVPSESRRRGCIARANHFPNPKPAPQGMQIGSPFEVPPAAAGVLHLAEPAEEEEQVAWTYPLQVEMSGGGINDTTIVSHTPAPKPKVQPTDVLHDAKSGPQSLGTGGA